MGALGRVVPKSPDEFEKGLCRMSLSLRKLSCLLSIVGKSPVVCHDFDVQCHMSNFRNNPVPCHLGGHVACRF